MGQIVNKRVLGEIVGKSDTALTEWQNEDPPMPVVRRGGPGVAGEYDTEAVIDWMIDRAMRRAMRESAKDRLDRITADLRELELYRRQGLLVETAGVRRSLGRLLIELRSRLLTVSKAPEIPESARAAVDEGIRSALMEISEYEPKVLASA